MATIGPVRDSAATKNIDRIYLGRLIKYYRRRWGDYCYLLPNDADGRAMMVALLHFGLSSEAAMQFASWRHEPDELRQLQRKARSTKRSEIGTLIKLTIADWEKFKLWVLLPRGVPEKEANRWRAARNREKARKRQQRKREKELEGFTIMRNTPARKEAIELMLKLARLPHRPGPTICDSVYVGLDPSWTSVPELVKQAATCKAFRRPDMQPLRNLRDAIHCTLRALAKEGVIEMKMRNGARGPVLFAKLNDRISVAATRERDTNSDCRSVGGRSAPKLVVVQ